MRLHTLAMIAAGSLALSGCPDDTTSIPLADAPARLGEIACERLRECNLLGELLLSQTSCDQIAYSFRNGQLSRLAVWVDDGSLVYDGAAMAGCLDDFESFACSAISVAVLADNGRCGQALEGQVAPGGACEDTVQCTAGNYCANEMACPGVCQPRVAAAGVCGLGAECAAGLDCAGGHCVPFGQSGTPCGGADLAECAMGFQCDTSRTQPTCQPITRTAASGATCKPVAGVLCQPGLVCAETDVASSTYECVAAAAAGGVCYRSVPNGCPPGQVCLIAGEENAGVCTAQAAVGQACLTGSGVLFGCAAGATCDFDTDLCVAMVDNGETCTSNAQCFHDCTGGLCEDALACE